MKVLIVAQLLAHSGVGIYITQLSKQLCDMGDEVHVLSATYDYALDDRVTCHRFAPLSAGNFLKNYKIFKQIVENNGINVVHIQHRIVGLYPRLYNLAKVRVPCTYILHTGKLEQNSFIKRMLTYSGEKTIAISSEVYACCEDALNIDPQKIELIYNGVDETKLRCLDDQERYHKRQALGIQDDKIALCIHGRIDAVKGHDVLLKAIRRLDSFEKNKLHLLISGDTENNLYCQEIKKEISEMGMSDQTTFLGWCEPQDILSLSDLMVQPSRREGFPLSAIEAFFMRVPVIRTRTGGYNDMKDCCVGMDIDDDLQLKSELSSFILAFDDSEKMRSYEEMIDRAYAFAHNNCTIEIMASHTRNVFGDLIDEYTKS